MIFELLPTGSENAVGKPFLMAITGLSDRALRLQVARERLEGNPILTSTETAGYYRPSCPQEAERFVRSMRNRARETAAIADAVEKSVHEIGGGVLDG